VRPRSLALLALIMACKVGPDYVRPAVVTPAAFKEGWKLAAPADGMARGRWWAVFDDGALDTLERQVSVSNQTLAAAEAQFRQARALVAEARAAFFPTITLGAGYARGSDGRTAFSLPLSVSWEPDFWGRVRRSVEASAANAQASAADVETARLSLEAELAQDYFQLRVVDEQERLLRQALVGYRSARSLTESRFTNGVAARTDVLQAEAQLRATEAQAIDLGVRRAQLEHALAVLVGRPPAMFALAGVASVRAPPPVPAGVPSTLLERRPDIAAAERRVQAANAQIGVEVAAYFPSITLGASAGLQSSALGRLLSWPSRFFALGPGASLTVFDGGLRGARVEAARAAHEAATATNRQTVLAAFQGVEDNLAALRILADEAVVQEAATHAAQESLALTTDQYRAGLVGYLNVITAQTTALTAEITSLQITGRRIAATILLIQALGGTWS
jgi:NodT family efflux transporter outer membrane factor (OMF) lipoprotein